MTAQVDSHETDALPPSIAAVESLGQMTEDEFVEWCDEDIRAEYVDGKVIIMSPESVRDERFRWFIGRVLADFVEEHDLGEVFGPNLQMRLRPRLRRIPDLLFISKDRLNLLDEAHFEGAPDLAMEFVSHDSKERDEEDKYGEYEAYGIREYWLVAGLEKRVEAYSLTEAGQYEPILPDESGVYQSAVIPGFFLNPEWLWRQPLPKKREILRELGL
jgi:Uma2 family endonuclease